MTKFWMEDILVLVNSNILDFVPNKSDDSNKKLNSMMRFSIYYSIISYAITKNQYVFLIPFAVSIITIFIYKNSGNNNNKKTDNKNDNVSGCVNPTDNNPFMNLNIFDINKVNQPACTSYNNSKISNKIDKIFNKDLYIDQDGIYSNNSSQNRYYTMPNTEPANQQKKLAEWLYKTDKSCKEGNPIQCTNNLPDRLNRISVAPPSTK